MIRKWIQTLGLLCSLFFLSSCTGAEELNIQAIVTAIGFDVGENGKVETHFQVVYPGGAAMKQGSSPEGGAGSPVYTYTLTADTMTETVDKARNLIPRKLFFPHIQVIVLGEQFAKEIGFSFITDYLERDNEIRDEFMVFTAKEETAGEILSVYTSLTSNPSQSIVDRVNKTASPMGLTEGIFMEDVIRWTYGEYRDPVTMGIQKETPQAHASSKKALENIHANQNAFDLTGIPLYKHDKLVDWLTIKQSKGWALIEDEAKETLFISAPCPEEESGNVGFLLKDLRSKKKAAINGEDIGFQVSVKGRGIVREVTCKGAIEDPAYLVKLKNSLSLQLSSYMNEAFEKTKENEVDSFGFGQFLYKNYPNKWKELEGQWMDIYLSSTFTSNFDIDVSGVGTRRKSVYEDHPK